MSVMIARVKQSARWHSVIACAGQEFVKGEWRVVKAGFEEEALRNPFLEVSAADDISPSSPSPLGREAAERPAASRKGNKRGVASQVIAAEETEQNTEAP